MREQYDLAFSLGFGCGCSKALRQAGLQYVSFPMDWIGVKSALAAAQIVASDFAGWLDRDALRLIDVRRDDERVQRSYVNDRTGIVFTHDFPYELGFNEAHAAAKRKYDRRIARLLKAISSSRRVLAVHVEHPVHDRARDEDLIRAHDVLTARFPGVEVDLLYFFHRDGATDCPVKAVADGVTAVPCPYLKYDDYGWVSHGIETDGICRYLKEHVEVADYRTEEERRQFAERVRTRTGDCFGRGLHRLIVRWQYRLYRKIGRDLKRKGILPRERPFWF